MDIAQIKKYALKLAESESNKEKFYEAADKIWSLAELGMEEFSSSRIIIDLLEQNGFSIEQGVAGMPTSFIGTFGCGKPVIGFSVEYDSLPGLSQQVCPIKNPVNAGRAGHGCGHNLLGVGAVKAAIILKNTIEKCNLQATIKVFGTPAEELCIGKPYMARAGLFESVDAFLDWHPAAVNKAGYDSCIAYFSIKYHYKGQSAHGNAPWFGRSALDAAILQANAVEMLREHIAPGVSLEAANTINYTFTDVGPGFPNVVPDRTTAWYVGRLTNTDKIAEVISRVNKCAEGAAMATGTLVDIELITATHEKIPNKTLARVMNKNFNEIGTPKFTYEEQEFIKAMQRETGVKETGLSQTIMPFTGDFSGLTDASEYSWFAPYAMVWVVFAPEESGWHNWMITACAGSSIGKKALDTAAKVLVATAVDLIIEPKIIEEAKSEFRERLAGKTYKSLIPDSVKPPLNINN